MSQSESLPALAEPFSRIFTNRAEAEWAFDLLRDTAKRLDIHGAYDARFALTLAKISGGTGLHLNFGGWLVLGFHGPGRIDLALLAERIAWDERFDSLPFARKEGEPEVRSYHLPLDILRPMTADLAAAYEATLDFIAHKFQSWKRAVHWQRHNPEIAEALFNPEQRERVLSGLLNEPELRYERHLTAFYQDISEEREEYEVGEAGSGRGEEAKGETEAKAEAEGVVDLEDVHSEYLLQGRSSMDLSRLAYQFSRIFENREEAEWTFDFIKETLVKFGFEGANDRRFTVRVSCIECKHFLSVAFGRQPILNFKGIDFEKSGVIIPLAGDEEEIKKFSKWQTKRSRLFSYKDSFDDIHDYNFPVKVIKSADESLLRAFYRALDYREHQFQEERGYLRPRNSRQAQEIIEAIFDPWKRDRLFSAFNTHEFERAEVVSFATPDENISNFPLSQLAEDTGLDETELARWVRAIERKGQAILYGPPGTGKTFVAEKLARRLTGGGDGFWELVQFHPAYAYEDFIQGIRPESQDGLLTYPLKSGRFLDFCQKASTRRHTCVLIIDEINRANLSRVFGELMYLLEYRDQSIPLAGGGMFKIPANVRLIGAMNTADRSIALVDHALRRRFAFIALYPNYDLLSRYHQTHQTDFPIAKLITVLKNLNRTIGNRHYEVGVTFFLRQNLSTEIEDIWRMEIEPYLEEYFFDRPEKLENFCWEKIKSQVL